MELEPRSDPPSIEYFKRSDIKLRSTKHRADYWVRTTPENAERWGVRWLGSLVPDYIDGTPVIYFKTLEQAQAVQAAIRLTGKTPRRLQDV